MWQATQAPSRSMYFEGRGESFIDDYVRIGCVMKNCGVDTICMCCNTAHIVVEELENRINVPFINLIEEVAIRVCNTPNIKKVGIMCSDGLRKFETYDEFIRKFTQTIEIVYPDSEHQALVTKGICNAKNTYRYTEGAEDSLPYDIMSACLVACSELYNLKLNKAEGIKSYSEGGISTTFGDSGSFGSMADCGLSAKVCSMLVDYRRQAVA